MGKILKGKGNITKPLKKGSKVAVAGQGSKLAIFKYKRISNFCYVCGCLNHPELDCDEVDCLKINGEKAVRQYGPWMRAKSNELLQKRD